MKKENRREYMKKKRHWRRKKKEKINGKRNWRIRIDIYKINRIRIK